MVRVVMVMVTGPIVLLSCVNEMSIVSPPSSSGSRIVAIVTRAEPEPAGSVTECGDVISLPPMSNTW